MTVAEFLTVWHNEADCVTVHTSGSTGQPRPMSVLKRRMEASARRTCRFLGLHPGDTALLCMPLDYIAGKMMVVRAEVWGLQLVQVPPSGHPLAGLNAAPRFAAMVPLQVYNALQVPQERQLLMQIDHLLIGGGAVDEALEQALQGAIGAVWSTYGMTETLSHVALRRLNGAQRSAWYTPLEGVSVSRDADNCLVISDSLTNNAPLRTNDIAELAPAADGSATRFRILGRRDNVICSGGIKIQMEEVETLLRPLLNQPYQITYAPDERLGQQVVLLLQGATPADCRAAAAHCRRALPRYWQPRHVLSLAQLPQTATGKPARARAAQLAADLQS